MTAGSDAQRPALTVFTIGLRSAADCRTVLGELRAQTVREQLEVLVVTPHGGDLDPHELEGFAGGRVVTVASVTSSGAAMAAGVRAARAPLVTYAEEHSYFDRRWAERLIARHGEGHDAVGFAMENANPGTLVSWAHLYGQFGPVVAPVASSEDSALCGHHVSYRTDLLLAYGDELPGLLDQEAALLLDLRARGSRLFLAGDAISRHVNISSLRGYVRHDFLGQRGFAAARARVGRWGWPRRAFYAAASPLIPVVRLRRIVADIRRSGRTELLPRVLAPMALALTAGAVGELLGYLAGAGDAAERRAAPDLDRAAHLGADDDWARGG